MPYFLEQKFPGGATVALWRIEESAEWFLEHLALSAAELTELGHYQGRRRTEWLAVRMVLQQLQGGRRVPLVKDDHGKPHWADPTLGQLSISHSRLFAAVVVAPVDCGIDIQHIVPKITRLGPRFMPEATIALMPPAQKVEQLHVCWGAKEALYKAYGRRAIDWCEHLIVPYFSYQTPSGLCQGRVEKTDYQADFAIHYTLLEDYMLTVALQKT